MNGSQGKASLPNKFPYDAMNPMKTKQQTFNSLDDVYEVLIECYDKCVNKGYEKLGSALYNQALFVVNEELIIDDEAQLLIKKHQFCKQFNCPPYPSVNQTPAKIIDGFMIIEQEIKQFQSKDNNGQ